MLAGGTGWLGTGGSISEGREVAGSWDKLLPTLEKEGKKFMRAGGFALFPLDGDGGIAQSAPELARGEHPLGLRPRVFSGWAPCRGGYHDPAPLGGEAGG